MNVKHSLINAKNNLKRMLQTEELKLIQKMDLPLVFVATCINV